LRADLDFEHEVVDGLICVRYAFKSFVAESLEKREELRQRRGEASGID
jgi:hypothetical protein